ncbi:VanZ family protein [Roseimaritima ulvae]|uniref:VanZ like family protein n=1 Tax=Roseimaritima ulvae TaxID=980254 RepID=A0A5B9R6X0_9BACT|nr:VanZ family protein [Roseimaritima ulvae]QEG42371.1 VanZ like family protein [Roseimaritima ulvae]
MNAAAEATSSGSPSKWHRLSRRQRWALLILLILALAALLVPSPFKGRVSMTVFDLFHFPAFAAICWLALRIGRRLGADRPSQRTAIAVTMLFVSAILEGLQTVSGRSATWHDLVANTLGVLAGWMLFEAASRPRRLVRLALCTAALSLWLFVCYGPAIVLYDLWKERREFPLIGSFESEAELTRWFRRNTNASLGKQLVTDGQSCLNLLVQPGEYPAFSHSHLPRDWSRFSALQFDWGVPADSPAADVQLMVRVADRYHEDTYEDTFTRVYRLSRGETQRVQVSLQDIQQGPQSGPLDLRAVRILDFQFLDIDHPVVVHLDNIRLLP